MDAGGQRLISMVNVGALTFGPGALARCADDLIVRRSRSVFIVTTQPTLFLCRPLVEALEAAGVQATLWHDLLGEPTL